MLWLRLGDKLFNLATVLSFEIEEKRTSSQSSWSVNAISISGVPRVIRSDLETKDEAKKLLDYIVKAIKKLIEDNEVITLKPVG